MVTAKNPLIAGFYPDPSICAVNDDFYLVNSSFAYFPGLPIMHSKDLANWEQIGNILDRPSQLPLEEAGVSRGLFAPTIRYYDGLFYCICTNVSFGGNFVVTAENPEGPWSEPHYIEGADGIDPSLFFDDDGKCYYCGTHENIDGCRYDGDYFIYIQEFDYKEFKLVGKRVEAWNGAMRGVHWPEGPHLYHIGDYYYIIHAEGGTGPEHAISVARSKDVFGPYENNFKNPIFTHRHLGKIYPIQYVGHGDLVQTVNGDWYMVMLAVRPTKGYTTMGRETFLARVIFEDDWPIVNPGLGVLSDELKIKLDECIPDCPNTSVPNVSKSYNFTKMEKLGPEFMTLRAPLGDALRLTGEGLELKCGTDSLSELAHPSYLCIRQDSKNFELKAKLYTDNLMMGTRAGICLFQSNEFHVRFEVSENKGRVVMVKDGKAEILAQDTLDVSPATLVMTVNGLKLSLYSLEEKGMKPFIRDLDISALSTEVAGGFVGCTVGIFATDGEDRPEPVYAKFVSLDYKRNEPKLAQ
ncbi:MAG: glycoside hydrolase family 43 protein [Lachnospiraceae bacterium]|nr:glycoside hydrolase family 43 protein [Lachnospiraceae bacterium]